MTIFGVPKLGDRRIPDKSVQFQLNELNLWQTKKHTNAKL